MFEGTLKALNSSLLKALAALPALATMHPAERGVATSCGVGGAWEHVNQATLAQAARMIA